MPPKKWFSFYIGIDGEKNPPYCKLKYKTLEKDGISDGT